MLPALLAGIAAAHPGAGDRLAAGATEGCDAAGWLAVSRGYLEEGRRAEALAAVAEAERCGIDRSVALQARAALAVEALEAGRSRDPVQALAAVDEALGANPGHRGLLLDRSRVLARLGRTTEAADAALAAVAGGRSRPDDVLTAVRLLVSAGDPQAALRLADEAIARSGPSPAVIEAALALELDLGRPRSALGRLDGLPPTSGWLDWRGRVAMRAGDPASAAESWARARELAANRPTPANRATVAALDELLAALGG